MFGLEDMLAAAFERAENEGRMDAYYNKGARQFLFIADMEWNPCAKCAGLNGSVLNIHELQIVMPPLHPNCRCSVYSLDDVGGNSINDIVVFSSRITDTPIQGIPIMLRYIMEKNGFNVYFVQGDVVAIDVNTRQLARFSKDDFIIINDRVVIGDAALQRHGLNLEHGVLHEEGDYFHSEYDAVLAFSMMYYDEMMGGGSIHRAQEFSAVIVRNEQTGMYSFVNVNNSSMDHGRILGSADYDERSSVLINMAPSIYGEPVASIHTHWGTDDKHLEFTYSADYDYGYEDERIQRLYMLNRDGSILISKRDEWFEDRTKGEEIFHIPFRAR
jgi:SPP1 gp7 family putative phage head morphogenesis protein